MKRDINKPMFLYYAIGIVLVFLISFMLMPKMLKDPVKIKSVSYNEFLADVDQNKVKEAPVSYTHL